MSKIEDIQRDASAMMRVVDGKDSGYVIDLMATLIFTIAKTSFPTEELQKEFILEIVRITNAGFKLAVVVPYAE